MTSAAIIEEIKRLSPAEQVEVIQFTVKLAQERPLTAKELVTLSRRMAESNDPAEAEKLKAAIVNGFYGEEGHA